MKNRPLTERKIINAVGEVIRIYGYKGLGINKIAQYAGVNKNLIYRYFGDVDSLVEIYIREKDYWLADNKDFEEAFSPSASVSEMAAIITRILQNQFLYFNKEEEMQHIILSEISNDSELLKRISQLRERMAEPFFDVTEKHFEDSAINFRGIAAILVSGIYYLVLQSQKNEAINCGINIRTEEGQAVILKSIQQVIEWSFLCGTQDKNK